MNKIYRAIWNETTQTWVAASELAKSKTKANTVSAQTSVRSLVGKISLNTFKVGVITSLVNMSLAIPNAYAADRLNVNGYNIWGYNTQASVNAVVLQGDDNVCGHDIVAGRSSSLGGLSALEEYKRFAQNYASVIGNKTYTPYGETTKVENWTDFGLTSGNSGYQSANTTGGANEGNGRAYGVNSFVYGCGSYATGNHSLAFGANATSIAGGAQAFGVAALASGRASNAIGVSSQATGVSAVALGSVANADGVGSVALGLQSNAAVDGAVAVGVQSQADGNSAVAIGNSNVAKAKESISIGSGNAVSGEGSIAVGNSGAATKFNSADGLQTTGASDYTRITGNYTLSLGNSNSGADTNSDITAANTTIFGNNNHINHAIVNAHIIGNNNAVDVAADANGSSTIVIGNNVNVSANDTLALGNNTTVNGIGAIAVGNQAKATANGAVALGNGSLADRTENTAGYNPDTDSDASTPVWKSTSGAVTVGNSERDITRQITDVAAGKQDTDAINVAQLKNLSSSVSGSVSSLSTSLEAALPPINTAIESVSSSVFDNITEINHIINTTSSDTNGKLGEISTNISELETSSATDIDLLKRVALLYTDGAYNVGSSDNRDKHKIINVAAPAQLSADSTDMVNGGQLYTTNSVLSSLSSTISTGLDILNVDAGKFDLSVSTSVDAIDKRINKLASSNNDISKLQQTILAWDGKEAFASDQEKKITGVEADDKFISIGSTYAVTGKQLRATNTLVNEVKQNVNDRLTKNELEVRKLELDAKKQLTASFNDYKALSTSVSTGISQITRDAFLYNNTKGVYEADTNKPLQKISNVAEGEAIPESFDAITGGQLYKTNVSLSTLSFSISTQLSSITKGRGDLSTGASTDLSSLSTTISTSLDNLTSSTSSSLKTLNSNLQGLSSSTSTAISNLRENTILRDEADSKFHATHQGVAQKITGIAPADISNPNSTDMVNGGQLYTTNSNITSLSSTVSSSFSSLSNSLSASVHQQLTQVSTNLNVVNDKISALQTDALQWNENAQAYSARHDHDGKVEDQKITHVQAGDIASLTSTDAVTGGQYYDLNTSIDTRIGELKTSALSSVGDVNKDISTLQRQMLRLAGDSFNAQRVEQNQKITGVAKATLNSASTDAVNGALLYSTSVSLSTLADSAASHLSDLHLQLQQNSDNTLQNGTSLVNGLNASISTLQKEVMQWNGSDKAFSANHGIAGKQRITNVAAGNVAPGSTEAIIMAQIHSFSTSTASAIEKVNQELINGVSISEIEKLAAAIENGLKTPNSNIATLKQNALQWNSSLKAYDASHGVAGGKEKITNVAVGNIAPGSTDAVTGGQLSKTNADIIRLSATVDTNLGGLSSDINNHLNAEKNKLSNSITAGINQLANSINLEIQEADSSIETLKQTALQWNGSAYDASHGQVGGKNKITNVDQGNVHDKSTDAVIGDQLVRTNTSVASLSTSLDSGLSSLSSSVASNLTNFSSNFNNSLTNKLDSFSMAIDSSLAATDASLSTIKQNALLWNSSFYDASDANGNKARITNVEAGRMAADSTDAINGSQLFSLSHSASTGLSSLSTNLSNITNNQVGSLSSTVSISLSTVNSHVSSLSVGLSTTDINVAALQQNALQWNSVRGVYDATRNGSAQKLTGIIGGDIRADSSDAINGAQMHSLSTLTQTGLNSTSTGLSSLSQSTSSGLNIVNTRLDSLSTVTQTGLSSISTGLSSLSSGLNSTKQDLATLQANALQWNGGVYDASHGGSAQRITNVAAGYVTADSTDVINGSQFFSLSNSTSTGLSSLSTNLSAVTDNQLGGLSSIVADGFSTVTGNVSKLSTSLSTTNSNIILLQQNALQRNRISGDFDARRDDNDQNLTGIAAGDINATSSDAINATQMHSLSTLTQAGLNSTSTGLSSLSSSTVSGLNAANTRLDSLSTVTQAGLVSVSTGLSSLSLSTTTDLNNLTASLSATNQNLTSLQQNALQWNSSLNAYDASHNGVAQRISNVAAGRMAADSTDAVNGGQLFSLSSSTSTGLNSLSTVISTTVISEINNINSSISTGYDSLSISLSTAKDGLDKLTISTSTSLSSLSTASQKIRKDVDYLKENSLQWNNDEGGFDAGKPNNLTRAPSYRKIINVEGGDIVEGSHEVVVGGQLFTVKSDLASLSTATSSSLSSLGKDLGDLINKENALLWNGSAYDARHRGITNVADGENSTDAVNAGQLWKVEKDLDNLTKRVNGLPTGNISHDALISLSTSISSSINSIASALGTPNSVSGGIVTPSYSTSATDGTDKTANSVAEALNNIHNYGTKYVKINYKNSTNAASAQGDDSIAIGGDAMARGSAAIAIGNGARAPEQDAVALGNGAQVKQGAAGGVALGAGSVADRVAGEEGYIPVTATQQQADAIRKTKSRNYGAVSVGDTSKEEYRQITGVAAGTADTDAVNVAQLKGVDNQVSKINEYVNQLNDNIHHVERRAYSGTAMAMALSGAYLPSVGAGEQTVGIGVGAYRSYGAVGINYKAASKDGKITWGAGVSTTGKEAAINSVIGFKW
ncbi:ESPR-type extended signal peptide-containing protein [Snodgrassella communis]|uniref:ESPR-type extended signal peptide-containing protein n=1 Tax=Snodgrassella communis TaxID=2946699 RepID=UPI001EF50C83|nr:ESPR-type extended signal peptide-containing protein [Snodgrassella communis]